MNEDDLKYCRYTGALTAMTRFLVNDLEKAVAMLGDDDSYQISMFQLTIDHAKQVLIDVEEKRDLQQDRTLSNGKVKTATGFVEDNTCTDIHDFAPDLGSNKP